MPGAHVQGTSPPSPGKRGDLFAASGISVAGCPDVSPDADRTSTSRLVCVVCCPALVLVIGLGA